MNGSTQNTNGTEPNFDTMTPAEFEQHLPDLFAAGAVSADPRLQSFLSRNPDCAALVRDLEAIASAAMNLFPVQEPSDALWGKIQAELGTSTPKVQLD